MYFRIRKISEPDSNDNNFYVVIPVQDIFTWFCTIYGLNKISEFIHDIGNLNPDEYIIEQVIPGSIIVPIKNLNEYLTNDIIIINTLNLNDLETFIYLLTNGANNSYGTKILVIWCVYYGRLDVLKYLVDINILPVETTLHDYLPITISENHDEVYKFIIDHEFHLGYVSEELIWVLTSEYKYINSLKYALSNGLKLSDSLFVGRSKVEIFQELFSSGYEFDNKLFEKICRTTNITLIKFFIDIGFDPVNIIVQPNELCIYLANIFLDYGRQFTQDEILQIINFSIVSDDYWDIIAFTERTGYDWNNINSEFVCNIIRYKSTDHLKDIFNRISLDISEFVDNMVITAIFDSRKDLIMYAYENNADISKHTQILPYSNDTDFIKWYIKLLNPDGNFKSDNNIINFINCGIETHKFEILKYLLENDCYEDLTYIIERIYYLFNIDKNNTDIYEPIVIELLNLCKSKQIDVPKLIPMIISNYLLPNKKISNALLKFGTTIYSDGIIDNDSNINNILLSIINNQCGEIKDSIYGTPQIWANKSIMLATIISENVDLFDFLLELNRDNNLYLEQSFVLCANSIKMLKHFVNRINLDITSKVRETYEYAYFMIKNKSVASYLLLYYDNDIIYNSDNQKNLFINDLLSEIKNLNFV
ncbi:putative ankyrin repeat protein [Acanthamoeba polyphaga mimivirus]|uniref:Ankyrin repeat protein n=1 Tax=Acanthamoeba polyphaga mimivirus Kroon TaxID=3069720 RepID=A0A0G2Y7A8_9VIRU|nr:putative ankyrin repeat protein [Acanthamoeba polyphaga mimivirus]AKI80474.1 putative ankyrin repeat protein [Acanthamoeba polyphaga mimivirus Kroon]